QEELDHRDEDHGGERHPVAAELDQLLDEHRPDAAERGEEAAAAGADLDGAHPKLSFARLIRSMNTSSSVASPRVQVCGPAARIASVARSSAASSRPLTCSAEPNGATMSTPGVCFSFSASSARPGPVTVQVARWAFSTTFSTL